MTMTIIIKQQLQVLMIFVVSVVLLLFIILILSFGINTKQLTQYGINIMNPDGIM